MHAVLSDNWHSVRWLKPQLREGVRVYHRVFRGRRAVVLFDPSSHRFHRLSLHAWQVVALFNGQRTLDDIWEQAALHNQETSSPTALNQQDAIGQPELVKLVSQLYGSDLIQSQVTPDAVEVLERFERQRKAKLKQVFLNPLSLKLPLFYPEPWMARQVNIARLLFSLPVFWCWLVLIIPAAILAAMHWAPLTENLSDQILNAHNLFIAWCVYPIVKALHEWAHALAIKRWGGVVREAGVMFLVFTPVPYVDATDSYGFANKWQRAAVAAAGIMAELALGALAIFIWVLAEPGAVRAIAYNVVIIAGASTLIVNGNPLMRYDGYFVLSELLEIPNMAQRSTKYWAYLVDRYVFRAQLAKSPEHGPGEAKIFLIYGAIAPIYRLIIALGLAWFVAEEYFIFGAIIALAGVWTSLVKPLWNGWKHIRTSPTLAGRYDQALRLSCSMALAITLLLACAPLPFYSVSEAVLWVPERAVVRAGAAGQINSIEVKAGAELKPGEFIAQLDNPKLQAEFDQAQAEFDELDIQLRKEQTDDIAKTMQTKRQLAAAKEKLSEAGQKVSALALRAGDKGNWVFVNGNVPDGQYFKRGEIVGYVVNGPTKILRVAVAQEDVELVRSRTRTIDVRLARRPWQTYTAKDLRPVAAGQQKLVSQALGSDGGGVIPVDPSDREGTTALQRVFDCEIELTQADPVAAFGDRAYVRFDLGWTPLAQQLFLRLRQAFLARLNV
jgi:putative peptide zinc metalloprotease protein